MANRKQARGAAQLCSGTSSVYLVLTPLARLALLFLFRLSRLPRVPCAAWQAHRAGTRGGAQCAAPLRDEPGLYLSASLKKSHTPISLGDMQISAGVPGGRHRCRRCRQARGGALGPRAGLSVGSPGVCLEFLSPPGISWAVDSPRVTKSGPVHGLSFPARELSRPELWRCTIWGFDEPSLDEACDIVAARGTRRGRGSGRGSRSRGRGGEEGLTFPRPRPPATERLPKNTSGEEHRIKSLSPPRLGTRASVTASLNSVSRALKRSWPRRRRERRGPGSHAGSHTSRRTRKVATSWPEREDTSPRAHDARRCASTGHATS